MEDFKNKRVAVLGLGIEGKDTINFLLGEGASVTLFDRKEEKELDFSGIEKEKIEIVTGKNYLSGGLVDFDYIVRSPGVYRYKPEIVNAERLGVKVTSAIKIFFNRCPGKIIGITGTKGKGTTATLVYEVLKSGGMNVYLVGNIGKPYLELLPQIKKDSWIVMEISSFQLIDLDESPHIAVVLNITVDHLDWHKGRNEYINAKKNIISYQKISDYAILNEEYETPRSFAKFTKAKLIYFSKGTLDGKFMKGLLLRGEHNLENIAATVAVCKIIGIPEMKILQVVRSFKGLEHRLQLIDKVNDVAYYNDSFATGPQPTIAAINSFTEPETLILGGSDKGFDYSGLGEEISKKSNIKNVILIGFIRNRIKDSLLKAGFNGKMIDMGKLNMPDIIAMAKEVTPKGGVVILSPAAASFDMFENYKVRGDQFKIAVQSLRNEKK